MRVYNATKVIHAGYLRMYLHLHELRLLTCTIVVDKVEKSIRNYLLVKPKL